MRASSKKKIMVVDDEEDLRHLLKWFFKSKDYDVVEIKDGEACLATIKKEQPDLILLDIMMPGLDGWEVSKRLKEDESSKDIPVSMLSVLSSPEAVKKSISYAHADTHLSKPIDFYMLNKTVKALIEKRKAYQSSQKKKKRY